MTTGSRIDSGAPDALRTSLPEAGQTIRAVGH
jgi:hypothetical protein